ncbi:MAG: alpha/beta fold hydrolase [Desulfobacteraceae bacterium]
MNEWIDKREFPFRSNYFDLPAGRMHYIDEGEGDVIVMVHGNPTWSFLYRYLIKRLSKSHRCIAMDHIGFGLSDKPADWSYLPELHAKNLHLFIDELNLKEITLVVQDWGGPIGLSYAVNKPENVKSLIIMNTWMWSVAGDLHYERFSGFMGGPTGRFLIKRFNFFVRVVMKQAMGDKSNLPKSVHRHYLEALREPNTRKGCWVFPKQIIASSSWLESLWSQREQIQDIPTLILWGMKDIAFREKELERWKTLFNQSKVIKFEDVGHFVQEEKRGQLSPIIEGFLSDMQA